MAAEQWYSMTGSNPVLGRIALVAVAVAAVGAFTVLQIKAWSRPPSRPARPARTARGRQARAVADWRTLPPQYSDGAADEEVRPCGQDDYGPLWRYGALRSYSHRDGPGHRREDGPGRGAGRSPGYPPGSWPPRGTPAPYEEPRDWGS